MNEGEFFNLVDLIMDALDENKQKKEEKEMAKDKKKDNGKKEESTNQLVPNKQSLRFVHDLWINPVEGSLKSQDIPEFHEWRNDDDGNIELIDQTPLIRVEPLFFTAIADNCLELPKELASLVKGKSYSRKVNNRTKIPYAFVMTDMHRVMFVSLGKEEDNQQMIKSKVIPRQYQIVISMAKEYSKGAFLFPIPVLDENDKTLYDTLPKNGLTRRERELFKLLCDLVDHLRYTGEKDEIVYWVTELTGEDFGTYKKRYRKLDKYIDDLVAHIKDNPFDDTLVSFTRKLANYYDKGVETLDRYDKPKVRS